jgi:hypothetical protein
MLRALFAVSGEALRGRFLSQQLLVKVIIFLQVKGDVVSEHSVLVWDNGFITDINGKLIFLEH